MMEISPWLIYWLMQLDKICDLVHFIAFFGPLVMTILIVMRTVWKIDEHSYSSERAYNATTPISKPFYVFVTIFLILNTFMPNTKTVAAMILVPPIVNNEQVQQIPDDILTFVRSVIKEYTFDNKEKK